MMDNKGQVSLEYLLIFAISLILLIAFTLPLAEVGLEKTFDVSNTLNVKSEVSRLSDTISQVYGEGQGSKHTLHLNLDNDVSLNIYNSFISTAVGLGDGTSKSIRVYHDSNLVRTGLYLTKGENTVVVEWPTDRANMVVYKKF